MYVFENVFKNTEKYCGEGARWSWKVVISVVYYLENVDN